MFAHDSSNDSPNGAGALPGALCRLARAAALPALTLALLAGVGWHQATYRPEDDYTAYHAACRAAVEALPTRAGSWLGREVPVPQPALELLDPNALRNIRFTDYGPQAMTGPDRRASLIVVQCRRARDMLGHYPPQCYPAHGAQLVSSEPRQWTLADAHGSMRIAGTEYAFAEPGAGGAHWGRQRIVLNFLMVPGVGIMRDMDGVSRAADDYRQRERGAAQVQVVFDAPPGASERSLDRAARDAVFRDLLTPALPALRTLLDLADPAATPGVADKAAFAANGDAGAAGIRK